MKWMARKFLVTLENQVSFNKDEVNHDLKVHKYSRFTWNVVSPQIRSDYYYNVALTRLELNDNYINIGV